MEINIISFNILAPIFTDSKWYPGINLSLLDTQSRIKSILEYINENKNFTDVFCFQETTESVFPYLLAELESDFSGFFAVNDKNYWENWIIKPMEYQKHGPSIFIKKSKFKNINFTDIKSKTGNNVAMAICKLDNQQIRFSSVHLDYGQEFNRIIELTNIMEGLNKNYSDNQIDFIIGDLNTDLIGQVKNIFETNYFFDLLKELNIKGSTIPIIYGHIDHILYRSSTKKIIPVHGKINDFEINLIDYDNSKKKVEESLKYLGSDHFPIVGQISF